MIAAIATFIWWNSPAYPFLNNLALALMVVCSVSTVVFNGNPLMRYDGYYVLADWLEIPNLRDRCNRYLQRIVMEHCLGIEVQPEPYMELWRRILFLTYAIVSYVYRWVITFVILRFMATFLKPYKLEIISNMLALMAAGSMIGWPIYRLCKNIHKRGRLPDMKPVRATVSIGALVAVILAFFLLPLPISRVRQSGLVQVQPGELEKVPVVLQGRLKSISVREGQFVRRGAVLAEFQSQQLDDQELKARSSLEHNTELIQRFSALLADAKKQEERDQLNAKKLAAENDAKVAQKKLEALALVRTKLVLTAPRDGYVMGLPKIDEIGKTWDQKDMEKEFCSIGDPSKLRVLVPVSSADYELVRDNLNRMKARGEKLEVTIRVRGLDTHYWSGHVSYLPTSADKTVPMALTTRGGGPLAVKPTSQPNQLEPQSQVYLVGIDFEFDAQHPDRFDRSIAMGSMAQVKIHNEYRSLGWWAWRSLSSTFDIGLM
jgi:putative peptide zinc metalloprotease protein